MPRSCADSFYFQLVYEYLLHMGLDNTAASLKEECSSCHYPVPEEICGVRRCEINNLLQYFDDEDETGFLKLFNSCLPQQAKRSLQGKKMIADILVYFAAVALQKDDNGQGGQWMKPLVHAPPSFIQNCGSGPKISDVVRTHSHMSTNSETLERTEVFKCCGQKICVCNSAPPETFSKSQSGLSSETTSQRAAAYSCMNTLLLFLESECSSLRDDPYFIPYFALPFIVCPQAHNEYKHIFQGSWTKSVRRRLWDFLVHHRQAASPPCLVTLLPSHHVFPPNQTQYP